MSTSFIAADVSSYMNWSVPFKWYIVHRQSVFLLIWEKLPSSLGGKGLIVNKYIVRKEALLYFGNWIIYIYAPIKGEDYGTMCDPCTLGKCKKLMPYLPVAFLQNKMSQKIFSGVIISSCCISSFHLIFFKLQVH